MTELSRREVVLVTALMRAGKPLHGCQLQRAVPTEVPRKAIYHVLNRMVDKGAIHRWRRGARWVYEPTAEGQRMREAFLANTQV